MTLTSANTNTNSNFTLPASSNNFNTYTAARIDASYKDTTTTGYGSGSKKIGVYYNYCAVSAGKLCHGSDAESIQYDICPKGWRLPTGTESQLTHEYYNLYRSYSNNYTNFRNALSVVLSGLHSNSLNGDTATSQGTNGYFWTNGYSDGTYMLASNFSSSAISGPQANALRNEGLTVRCIKIDDRTISDATYMQDVVSVMVDKMANLGTATLTDKRDNKQYTVAKINNQLWMTKNLDLAGGTALTSELSNVTSNYTLPASSTTGFSVTNTAYVYNSNSTTCNKTSPCYSYYSFVAASAGTGGDSLYSGNTTSDICPKGWRLPTQTEVTTLSSTYTTGSALTSSPFLGVYSGFYMNSAFNDYAYNSLVAHYWSSTVSNAYPYRLTYADSGQSSVSTTYKQYGMAVRCVLK